jgi:hypothetical protein
MAWQEQEQEQEQFCFKLFQWNNSIGLVFDAAAKS